MIAWLGRLSYEICGPEVACVRLLPTLAGIGILVLCALITRELGGKWRATLFSTACLLAFLPFYRNHSLFQPVAFDQLFWLWSYYLLLLYVNRGQSNFLITLALVVSLGILTKYTMLI